MFGRTLHRLTAAFVLAAYFAAVTFAGRFHVHADVECCSGTACSAHSHADPTAEEAHHDHTGHSHGHAHHHHHHGKKAERPVSVAVSPGAPLHAPHHCAVCQLLSEKSTAPVTASLTAGAFFSIPAPTTTDEFVVADLILSHPARGPPAA